MPERILTANEASLAYNTRLDVRAYRALLDSKLELGIEKFNEQLESLNQLTRFNLETSVGERFNVELFQTTYHLEENLIKHPLYREPFIDTIRRGQQFRLANGSTDVARETAEIVGFEKVEAILIDEEPGGEKKVVVISPKGIQGSIYQHNFFDVYEKNHDGTITMSRYTSKLSWNEFYQAAQDLDLFNNIPDSPKDADFLANPLITYKSIDQILEIMHPQEETMSQKEYQKLLIACTPLILIYMRNLMEDPQEFIAERNYNAILKFADVYTGFDRQITSQHQRNYIVQSIQKPELAQKTAMFLAAQEIRQVATACGISGSSMNLFRPFSVSEFGLSTSSCSECTGSENHFHCPGCGGQISSGFGITTCPHCGLTKEEAGSNCG